MLPGGHGVPRIAVIADVHLGNHGVFGGARTAGLNRRAQIVADTLDRAVTAALGPLRCDQLVVAGDLFDTTTPAPALIARAQEALRRIPSVVLVGNHDQTSTAPGDHALGPLVPVATVVDQPTLLPGLALVPFRRPSQDEPTRLWVPKVLAGLGDVSGRLLVLHTGLSDGDTPVYLADSAGAYPVADLVATCAELGIPVAVAGDWHRQRAWSASGVQVAQVGALVPTGFDEHGLDGFGGLVVWDSDAGTLETHQIPGLRFVTGSTWADVAPLVTGSHPRAVQLTVGPHQVARAHAEMETNPDAARLLGWRVVADKVQVEAQHVQAAQATKVAQPAAQVAAWVGTHGVPAGLDPSRVVRLAQEYLTK